MKNNQKEAEHRIRVLMLVNWKVTYAKDRAPEGIQPPDYVLEKKPYWFFRYMSPEFAVDVVDISAPVWIGKVEKKLRFYIWQTLRVLPRVNQYDLVLSHGMQSGIVLALWRRLFGRGRYHHVVFDIGAFNSGRRSGRSLKLMQFASKSLDGVIYHTKVQREYYEACHPWLLDKSRFIPFGTDAEFFAEAELAKEVQREGIIQEPAAKQGQEKPYILSFGKIKRDWDTLLEAYLQSNHRLSLKIIGNSELHCADPQVEILPAMPLSKLQEYIRGAAFCVVPLEVLPYSYGQMTLLQQMAMGKAVIAADVPSLAAYHDDEAVLWYSPKNVPELTEKMNFLSDNPEYCRQMGKKAAERIQTTYNEKNMAGEIQVFLYEVLGSQGEGLAKTADK